MTRALALAALLAGACDTFDDPPLGFSEEGGAGSGGVGGSSGEGGTAGTAGTGGGGSDGSSGSSGSGGASGDAGVGPWWAYKNEHSCQSAGVPSSTDKPAFDDGGQDLPPIYIAQSKILMGTGNLVYNPDNSRDEWAPDPLYWRKIGFDFDKKCYDSAGCEAEGGLVRDQTCKPPTDVVFPLDGDNCIDNQIGKLFSIAAKSPNVGTYFGMTEPDWNCELRRGGFTIITKISNYNGKLNDRSVRVDIYESPGLKKPRDWFCRNLPDGGGSSITGKLDPDWTRQAIWTPTDHFYVARSSLSLNGGTPPNNEVPDATIQSQSAYVRGGYLFATMPSDAHMGLMGNTLTPTGLNTPIPGFPFVLERGLTVAQLVRDTNSGAWLMKNGVTVGVVNPSKMLDSYRKMGFCENMTTSYCTTTSYLNDARDLMFDTSESDPVNFVCNGLSWASLLEGQEIKANNDDVISVAPLTQCPDPPHPSAPRQKPDAGTLNCNQ